MTPAAKIAFEEGKEAYISGTGDKPPMNEKYGPKQGCNRRTVQEIALCNAWFSGWHAGYAERHPEQAKRDKITPWK